MKLRESGGNSTVDNFLMALMGDLENVKKTFPEGLMDRGKVPAQPYEIYPIILYTDYM